MCTGFCQLLSSVIINVAILNFCVFHMNVCTFFPLAGIFWTYLETTGCAPIAKHINTKHVHRMPQWDTTLQEIWGSCVHLGDIHFKFIF